MKQDSSIKFDAKIAPPSLDHLYHYTTYKTGLECILERGTLRFNSLENTNDPWEFQNIIHVYSHNEASEPKLSNVGKLVGFQVNDIRKRIKTVSFCRDAMLEDNFHFDATNENKGFARMRMWGQYGDDHKGMCFVYNRDCVISAISAFFDTEKLEKRTIFQDKIFYGDLHEVSAKIRNVPKLEEADLEGALKRLDEHKQGYLFSKDRDYFSEFEYRISFHHEKCMEEEYVDIPMKNALSGVILGCDFPDIYIPCIESFQKTYDIPVWKISWYMGSILINELRRFEGD